MEHACIHVKAFHGSFQFEDNIMHNNYTHNSILLQASSPTECCRSKDRNFFTADNPAFKRGIVKLLADYMIPIRH